MWVVVLLEFYVPLTAKIKRISPINQFREDRSLLSVLSPITQNLNLTKETMEANNHNH